MKVDEGRRLMREERRKEILETHDIYMIPECSLVRGAEYKEG